MTSVLLTRDVLRDLIDTRIEVDNDLICKGPLNVFEVLDDLSLQ